MRKAGCALLAGMWLLLVASGGRATEPPSWKTSTFEKEKATVEAIDRANRMVTLKGAEGHAITFRVSEEVPNLAQVKVGDLVEYAYYESIAVRVLSPGEAFPPSRDSSPVRRADPGAKPAGIVGREVSVNATIAAIDRKAKTVTLKGQNGNTVTVTPKDPSHLEKVKVGDRLVITYTEAVAVSVKGVAKE